MKVEFRASFEKDLRNIQDRPLLRRVQEAIGDGEAVPNIREIRDLRKLRGEGNYYRIRLGDYRTAWS